MIVDTEHQFSASLEEAMNIECLDIRSAEASRSRVVAQLLRLREAMPPEDRPEAWALVSIPGCPGEYAIVIASDGPVLEVSEDHLKFVESIEDVDIAAYLEAAFE